MSVETARVSSGDDVDTFFFFWRGMVAMFSVQELCSTDKTMDVIDICFKAAQRCFRIGHLVVLAAAANAETRMEMPEISSGGQMRTTCGKM